MQQFKKILYQQIKLHPSLLPQDIVKLCYQATFGAEHLLLCRDTSFAYFMKEYTTTPAATVPIFEPICKNYAKCNIGAWKKAGLPAEWLFEMFYATASEKSLGTEEQFWNYIKIAESLLPEDVFSFSEQEWNTYLNSYQTNGVFPVHHSEQYRKKEQPAYRLIHTNYTKLFSILETLAKLAAFEKNKTHILAIEGRAAAGKSTIAKLLSPILHASIIQMDDFFLPPALRTTSRLNQSGGNIHYERFCKEVLPFLHQNVPFSYRYFDCSLMNYQGKKTILPNPWYIIEGSYSMHPIFGNYMDFSIFCDIKEKEQLYRILARNGSDMLQRFMNIWIPLEEQYFEMEHIQKRCNTRIYWN